MHSLSRLVRIFARHMVMMISVAAGPIYATNAPADQLATYPAPDGGFSKLEQTRLRLDGFREHACVRGGVRAEKEDPRKLASVRQGNYPYLFRHLKHAAHARHARRREYTRANLLVADV